ncbi:LacI family transcriptional regulator (plasmid) [Rhodococcus opacus]|uniref:LacI family transcriptional regulator n=1 Tax=Rhodococcus opacus TaxID=37919 RepID=A0A1B1KH62_RHOOP|nr:LacI family DNA-binding transcriptional regulator [Rhodococcus opacus]ANS31934.1 LacI family transcriptional regulator [Rhodococcus opacus]
MANIKDVARHAKVSMTTVSHVLNGRGRVATKTRERVLEAAVELGYTANPHAQQLVTRKSHILVIQMPDLDNNVGHGVSVIPTSESEYFLELINGAAAAAADVKYALVAVSSGVDPSSLNGFGIDGMIIVDPKGTEGVLQSSSRVQYPIVTTGEPALPNGHRGFVIDNDHGGATRIAMDHFVATGRSRPALIIDTTIRSFIRDIDHAYREWCQDHDMLPKVIAVPDASPSQTRQALDALRSGPDPVDAIYVSSDGSAISLLNAARATGVSVPDDLALASAIDSSVLRATTPTITGTLLHPRDIGAQAIRTLTELIARSEPDCDLPPPECARQIIPTKLLVRGSSLPAGQEDTSEPAPIEVAD